jgi:hypothetical protein
MSTVHVNAIAVGSDLFTSADWQEVSDSIQRTRTIYATIGLTVGRVEWYGIPVGSARGREHIDDNGEAEALTDEWTVPNHALDVFFVRTYAGATIGLSRLDGPCDKNAKGMDGSVVAIEGSTSITGLVAAHEMAHYLGLGHVDDVNNLMNPTVPNNGNLSADQGNNMRDHCFVV